MVHKILLPEKEDGIKKPESKLTNNNVKYSMVSIKRPVLLNVLVWIFP